MQKTDGPWHGGWVATGEAGGAYISVVAPSPEHAAACIELLTGYPPKLPPEKAMVGRTKT